MNSFDEIEEIKNRFQKGKEYNPYISFIKFCSYKNLVPESELIFEFPLTLLIGKNGTNKSSILHALYGCPEGNSTGEYWFESYVDLIKQRSVYWYKYISDEAGQEVEVAKSRIKKQSPKYKLIDSSYWEPTRPLVDFGMKPIQEIKEGDPIPPGRSKTRWNAIKKKVIYLDFRSEISAFDRAFYFDSKGGGSRPKQRRYLFKRSKLLKNALDKKLKSKTYYGKEKISEHYNFSIEELQVASDILDIKYSDITYIEHDFYNLGGFSIYINKDLNDEKYSEAFAGSGEASVIRLIYAIENAKNRALILLDEPETSLHIGAQIKLQKYILKKITEKKLQVILSTHSPYFATGLPDCAIKLLISNPGLDNKIQIINSAVASESSFHLGYTYQDKEKLYIYVEDSLSKYIVTYVQKKLLNDSKRDRISIEIYPGGTSSMVSFAAMMSSGKVRNSIFLFDGDFKKEEIPEDEKILVKKVLGYFGEYRVYSWFK
ncbi:MAG TPA: AAA family ATPase [Oligoflexia bacterium]|nr:AAA family ATPase [Oligoflexia bacterium]HMR25357.1 AAA family ATPase [Oligoflexia bacterium]